jgi:hypothetical protein
MEQALGTSRHEGRPRDKYIRVVESNELRVKHLACAELGHELHKYERLI